MTIEVFLLILTGCSAITSLITEGVKKLLDSIEVKYAANILVLIIAVVVGIGATALYYAKAQIPYTALNLVYLALMGLANWIGAMLGYDKIIQTIKQIKG